MRKNPGKDMHATAQERWVNRNRLNSQTGGEIKQVQSRLEALLQKAGQKNLKLSELMRTKASEAIRLKDQLNKSFKKSSEAVVQKVMVKANMELENHLHKVERELDARKMEIKNIRADAQALAVLLRKKFRTGPRAKYPGN